MYQVLDLFSGIGGFSLGLERTGGFKTVAFCEIEEFPRKVLAKHWPDVPIYRDVRELTGEQLRADGIAVDVICGGFPCQDISTAGKGAGIDGARSGLWSEYARLIGELRPRYVIVENVAALLGRGLGRVLGDLAALGYDAEWHCIPASAVGAPHRRDRLWIVAYPGSEQHEGSSDAKRWAPAEEFPETAFADAHGERKLQPEGCVSDIWRWISDCGPDVANAYSAGLQAPRPWIEAARLEQHREQGCWAIEPDVGRVVARFSSRMDGGRLDGTPTSGGTGEILQAMRGPVPSEGLQWPARGYGGLQAPEVLLDALCGYEGKARPLGHVSLASEKASGHIVRGVWFDGTVACPSCRRAAREQRGEQHPDPVRVLPQLLACNCGSAWLDPTGTPSETSRVDRLKGLGNAVVPQLPELIGRAILEAA